MYKVGVVSGKFSPPHRGHLNAILNAAAKCEKLYVVISHNQKLESKLYENSCLHMMSLLEKERCLSIELQDFEFIKIKTIDEDALGIEEYPNGWEKWSTALHDLVYPEKIDVIFGAELEYKEGYTKYFPDTRYELYDVDRTRFPISATEIRKDVLKNWDYVLGSARRHFVKRVLITGTESCAKTTLTKMLAKIYNTSYALEEGRYYSTKYLGGNEGVFTSDDFFKICIEQRQLEDHAMKTSNKICFFDTDNIITQFYHDMYLGGYNTKIEVFNDHSRFDLILMMKPSVKWVADGFRWTNDQQLRESNHDKLLNMYRSRGYNNIVEIGGNYSERLEQAIHEVNTLLKSNKRDV